MYFLLFVLWFIFHGKITLEISMFGIVSVTAIFWFLCKYMGYSLEKEKRLWKFLWKGCQYVCHLLVEIVRSNFIVLVHIFTVKEEVEPLLVSFPVKLKHDISKVVLANSITLTPGTITVDIDDDRFLVHCLDKTLGDDIENCSFVEKLQQMEEIQ